MLRSLFAFLALGVHRFAGEDLQGFDAVGGFERGVALGLERHPQEFPVGGRCRQQ